MRKSIVFFTAVLTGLILCLGYLSIYLVQQPVQAVDLGKSKGEQAFQSVVAVTLVEDDITWQRSTVESIISYRDNQDAQEILQATLDAQKEAAKQELLRVLQQEAQEREKSREAEEAMRAQALNAIYSSGGRDVQGLDSSDGDDANNIVSVPDNSVKMSDTGIGKAILSVAEQQSEQLTETVEVAGRVEDPDYLGQVTAIMVCTCSDCWDSFRASDFPGVAQGTNVVFTDGTAIPTGVKVSLSSVEGEYMTELSGRVSGRNVVVLCSKHEVATAYVIAYPKVTLDRSVG